MFLCLTEPITNLPNVLRMYALYHENHHIVALFVVMASSQRDFMKELCQAVKNKDTDLSNKVCFVWMLIATVLFLDN